MICAVCGKESNNRRVCPYCFTPYPAEAPQSRQSTSVGRQSTSAPRQGAPAEAGEGFRLPAFLEPARAFVMRQSPVVRWTGLGMLILLVAWFATARGSDSPVDLTPGTVPSNIIASPMQRAEAIALIKRTRETALVDMSQDEVFVSYPAATFPVQSEGQVALAQQFARADEIVEGRKRRIFFYNPSGRLFAQSDGVTGVRLK